ncbi:MAG: hypothetical protein HYR91_05690 [Flavobacteriia bacterium]|nr:hypothetical protein [Flavobacteriia bacterium]
MKKEDEIEDLFASAFEEFSVTPPTELKSSIERKIYGNSNKKMYWLFLSLAFIGLVTGLYIYNSSVSENNEEILTAQKTELLDNVNTIREENSLNKDSKQSVAKIKNIGNSKKELKQSSKINQVIPLSNQSQNVTDFKHSPNDIGKDEPTSTNAKDQLIRKKTPISTSSFSNQKKKKKLKGNRIKYLKINDNLKTNNLTAQLNDSNNNSKFQNISNKDGLVPNLVAKKIGVELEKDTSKSEKSNDGSGIQNISNNNSDSLLKQDENVSLNTVSIDTTKKEDPLTTQYNWMASIRFGTGFGSNYFPVKPAYNLTERNGYFLNIEASRLLNSKISIASGINLEKTENKFTYTYSDIDSTIIGYDTSYIPIIDSNGSTIGYTEVLNPNYSLLQKMMNLNNVYSVFNLSIPLYFGFTQKINTHAYFDLNAGLMLNYQSVKLSSGSKGVYDPVIRNFGATICLRPQFRYQFNQFGISLNSLLGYSLNPALNWGDVARKRIYTNFGIGLHYNLRFD